MRELREQTGIEIPVEEAEASLVEFFAAREDGDGVTRMRLRVQFEGSSLALEREVRIEARPSRDEANLNNLIELAWQPEGTVVFPRFEGTLITWGEEDPKSSVVELHGHYTPPLGIAGQVFDEAIGFSIAQSTAREFLRDIKREIESRARFKKRLANGR